MYYLCFCGVVWPVMCSVGSVEQSLKQFSLARFQFVIFLYQYKVPLKFLYKWKRQIDCYGEMNSLYLYNINAKKIMDYPD